MNIQQIRLEGQGNGFRVLDPHDGFRKDDRLWFGTCDQCGKSVTNSSLTGVWEHQVYTNLVYYSKESRFPNSTTSFNTTYCPKVEGKEVEPIIEYRSLDGDVLV